jgi:hypothetical protein
MAYGSPHLKMHDKCCQSTSSTGLLDIRLNPTGDSRYSTDWKSTRARRTGEALVDPLPLRTFAPQWKVSFKKERFEAGDFAMIMPMV